MKHLRLQLHRLSVVQISTFLMIFGLFLGVLCANVFKNNYAGQLQEYEQNIFMKISTGDIDYSGLFRYILGENMSEYLVFWLLSITILGIPYIAFKITSFGFFTGFFISAITMRYGLKGIILVLAYIFPHGIVYLPIALISLYKGFELCKSIYHDNQSHLAAISRLIKSYLLIILILAGGILVASFLEAYPGAYLLKKALELFY